MTSSYKDNPMWNFNNPTYKDFDPFCEPGLISILFLSNGKHKIAKVCLDSTKIAAALYNNEIEWLFIDQGYDENNYRMFMETSYNRKVIVRQDNQGINNGINQLWTLSRGEYCLILESDWWNDLHNFNFLQIAKDILDEKRDIGIIQLRAIYDQNESWGFKKPEYWPWSCREKSSEAGFKVFEEKTKNGHQYLICNFPNGFCNNPILMRKKLYRECGVYPEPPRNGDPRHGETLYQSRVEDTGYAIAHIGKEVYYHAGGNARNIYEAMY